MLVFFEPQELPEDDDPYESPITLGCLVSTLVFIVAWVIVIRWLWG